VDAVGADRGYMAKALALAERGRGRTSPNPMVGAIVVDDDGVVVGRGAHEVAGGPHAEVHALADAGDRARGATLYCTLEPCSHTGRTGPCAPLVARAGIRRAVVGVEDPNPKVSGRGLEYLRAHGVDVVVGVEREAAARLIREFSTVMRQGRPFVTLKAALSLDARVAAGRGQRTPLTGPDAGIVIHRERAEVDAIAIGSTTALVDDPELTPRIAYRARPLVRVIFDRRLRTPPSARIFATLERGPVIVATSAVDDASRSRADALERRGATIERVAGDEPFLEGVLRRLAGRGVLSTIVEGGPTLQEAFWRAGLVDRLQLFVAPVTLGPDGVDWMPLPQGTIAALGDAWTMPLGADVLIEGSVRHGETGRSPADPTCLPD
jgi:diaminohydroxyphosphoribosylaminopyrimidine deaminase/5-amino-6-(5-phosphoribosylamino)uracil reductase